MNTYVMGEIAILLAVTVLAGILIGWCIKSLLSGRTERKVRAHVARDVDDAAADVANIKQTLLRREAQLKDANHELQKMRGRDMSFKAGSDTQVDEINKLKNELALARQSLDRNRTEFNSFRNVKLTEVQSINNQLASYQTGGSVHDERMIEANETIGALRTAVRENDKVIDSLRARIKEGDSSVENLRTQLKTSETTLDDIQKTRHSTDASIATLNADFQEATTQRDKFKRDYDSMLENKNREITRQQQKLEDLGKVQTTLQQKDHEYKKLQQESQANSKRSAEQLSALKRSVSENESQRAESLKNLKRLQDQVTTLDAKNKALVANAEKQALLHTTQLQQASKELDTSRSLGKQVENKSAEVIALNDMLKDVSNKRTEAQTRAQQLEVRLKSTESQAAAAADAQRKIASTTTMLQERDATIAKLRSELDDIVDNRNSLNIQLGELQTSSEKTKTALTQQSQQQIAQMQTALQDRDKSFDKLRSDMDQMAGARDRLTGELEKLQQHGSQLETFKSSMETTVAQRDTELQQRKAAYEKLQHEFNQLANTRDDYEKRISALTAEVTAQSKLLKEQEQRTATEVSQTAALRSRLSLADSENQKLNSELSDSAELNLSITERDSVIQKLSVELQDAKMNTASSNAQEEAKSKIDSLTSALKDRDIELARMNNIVTDNRLSAKKHQSDSSLLKQEIESQRQLITGLEEQAENTLTLHKKIAAQSTEIEDLRATMYRGDTTESANATTQEITQLKAQLEKQSRENHRLTQQLGSDNQSKQSAELKLQVARLQSEVQQRNTDIQRLQKQNNSLSETSNDLTQLKRQLEQRDRQLDSARQQTSVSQSSNSSKNQEPVDNRTAAAKPRVFVRQNNESKVTESLTGVAANSTGRAAYTRDGYKLKHTNGKDNLALLPGISARTEKELNDNGVADFEQIALWSSREISHFAERTGVSTADAERYNWPALARQILDGTYRRSEYEHTDKS